MIAPTILRKKRSRLTLGLEIAELAVWVCVSDSGLSSAGRSVAAHELRRRERRGGESEGGGGGGYSRQRRLAWLLHSLS